VLQGAADGQHDAAPRPVVHLLGVAAKDWLAAPLGVQRGGGPQPVHAEAGPPGTAVHAGDSGAFVHSFESHLFWATGGAPHMESLLALLDSFTVVAGSFTARCTSLSGFTKSVKTALHGI
jgi:hypothetical protein